MQLKSLKGHSLNSKYIIKFINDAFQYKNQKVKMPKQLAQFCKNEHFTKKSIRNADIEVFYFDF